MRLLLDMELSGKEYLVGSIVGEGVSDAAFVYDQSYMQMPCAVPVSVGMPFQKEAFTPERTRIFFEGLLPEGFTRRTVAHFIQTDEDDYLKILAALGRECLGALRVTNEAERREETEDYEEITPDEIRALAREGATKSAELVTKAHLSLTGASGKAGLYYDEKQGKWYLPKGTAPSTHIVKQSHVRLHEIVANEQLSLMAARKMGIETPNSFILNVGVGSGHDSDETVLFVSKRYDRKMGRQAKTVHGLPRPFRLHQEDFAQALGIASANKYEREGERHMGKAFALVRNVSVNPIEDQMKLWKRIAFNFLLGNTDAHLKNFSLIYNEHGKGIRLAPAYDMISTVIYEQSTRDMAFRIGDVSRIDDISRNTFEKAASQAELGSKIAMRVFDEMANDFEKSLLYAADDLREQGFVETGKIAKKILEKGGYRNL